MNQNLTINKKQEDFFLFQRIEEKFKQYWTYLLTIVCGYVLVYSGWKFISQYIKSSNDWYSHLAAGLLTGILFSLDGFITALLKTPYGQFCHLVNNNKSIPRDKTDYLIMKITESTEHCKETLKKFGICAVVSELFATLVSKNGSATANISKWANFKYLGYLIPLTFAFYALWKIKRTMAELEKEFAKTDFN